MDLSSLRLLLALWALMSRQAVVSLESLNMSCLYQISPDETRSVTCSWSDEPGAEASLQLSRSGKIYSCIFSPSSIFNVTTRIKSLRTGEVVWSQPQPLDLSKIAKYPPPAVTLIHQTDDSLVVSWKSDTDKGTYRLRYKSRDSSTWTEVSDQIPIKEVQNYTIKNLLPFMVYKVSVAYHRGYGLWSDWSSEATGRTLDRVPSKPAGICYRVKREAARLTGLQLIWMASDPGEAEGRVLGYNVSINSVKQDQNGTEMMALPVEKEGNYSVAVQAFNTAGFGPAALLQINTQAQNPLLSVRNLSIYSRSPERKELQVQWTSPSAPVCSHVAVQWHSEQNPSTTRSILVDCNSSSTVIRDLDPDEFYQVSVFPAYQQQCGPPQSLEANLELGALMKPIDLKVVSVSKTSVTVMWEWQKAKADDVAEYKVMLRRDTDQQGPSVSLWPDLHQHIFSSLTPNTEYSLILSVDGDLRDITTVKTQFDEAVVVAPLVPLLLLIISAMICFLLFRTLYNLYFFPPICNPNRSMVGQWLLNPNREKCAQKTFLDISDFKVKDFLGDSHLILVTPEERLSSSEDLREKTSLQSMGKLSVFTSTDKLDFTDVPGTDPTTGQGFDIQPIKQQQLDSLQSVFTSKDANIWSPHREEAIYPTSHHGGPFPVFPISSWRQLVSESEELEGFLEVEYITNNCFRAESTAGEETSDICPNTAP
uniref:Interleukin-6 receptor subunit beta-like n=1 Tax=Cyprinodon variegatus TaxID=28743 RepID=A0A3Q2G130_CYPVA